MWSIIAAVFATYTCMKSMKNILQSESESVQFTVLHVYSNVPNTAVGN